MARPASYAERIGELVAVMPLDTVSHSGQLELHGVLFADARHAIDLARADEDGAELLGCGTGEALLRERRLSTDPAGSPVEWSQDARPPRQRPRRLRAGGCGGG
ncbi:UTRA domain-containing protein [Streptomyces sp. NPDC059708]|uniref:UTRA domain-containing protein n=1 Tax=Streptomyces sp. NPDC059708 TaxID=3346916 RepID=UPI00368A5F38